MNANDYIPYQGDDWVIAEWPDGTWCNLEDVYIYLQTRSDDYELRRVLTFDPNGYFPGATERYFPGVNHAD